MNSNEKALRDALQVLVNTAEIRQFLEDNDPQALKQAEEALGIESAPVEVEPKFRVGDYIYHQRDREAYIEGTVCRIVCHPRLRATCYDLAQSYGPLNHNGFVCVELQDEWEKQEPGLDK